MLTSERNSRPSASACGLREERMEPRALRLCGRRSDLVRELARRTALVDAEAAAGEYLFVDARVEIGEALAELDLLTVDGDRAERRPHAGLRRERQIRRVSREKPAHARPLELDVSRHASQGAQVHLGPAERTEQPQHQIDGME